MVDPNHNPDAPDPNEVPIVHDRRRIDPVTGEVRRPAEAAAGSDQPNADPVVSAETAAAQPGPGQPPLNVPDDASALDDTAAKLAEERLRDLQRLQAEYMNYRRRVERDRDLAKDKAIQSVLEALLPTLDDIALAREHGDLDGTPFAAIAEKLDGVLTRFGLVQFGEVGTPFDPTVHDALMHNESPEVDEELVTAVLQPGYLLKDRVLRAARVAVTAPGN